MADSPYGLARSLWLRWVAVVAFAVVLGALLPGASWADGGSGSVSWSVVPADESGPDGRTTVKRELDPGESVTDYLAVKNLSKHQVTFNLSAADGFYTAKGRFDMLASDKESVDAGTWIKVRTKVSVGAGQSAVVPYTLTVPEDAEPGDHAAGVAASVVQVESSQDGAAAVGVESRVGFQVLTRVKGELAPGASITDISTVYHQGWNPLGPGRATVAFTVKNVGNTRVLAAGRVRVGGQEVEFPASKARPEPLLPGQSRRLSVEVGRVWPLVHRSGGVELTPSAVTFDGDDLSVDRVNTPFGVWAWPLPQLLAALGLALVVLGLSWNRIRSRKRVADLVAKAREEGRQAATGELGGSTPAATASPARDDDGGDTGRYEGGPASAR